MADKKTTITLSAPPVRDRMYDTNTGFLTLSWTQWYNQLYKRVGGTSALNNTQLEEVNTGNANDVETLKTSIDTLNTNQLKLESEVSDVNDSLGDIKNQQDIDHESVVSAGVQIKSLQNTVSGFQTSINTLTTGQQNLTTQINSFNTQLNNLTNTVNSYGYNINVNSNNIANLRNDLNQLSSNLNITNTQVESNRQNIASIRSDMALYDGRITTNTTDITNLKTTVNTNTTDIANIKANMYKIRSVTSLPNDTAYAMEFVLLTGQMMGNGLYFSRTGKTWGLVLAI